MIDLTGAEVKVIGNQGDVHLFRINDSEENIINSEGTYQAEFFTSYKSTSSTPVVLDDSELENGTLLFNVIINSGFYRIKRLSPPRTLVTIEVESR